MKWLTALFFVLVSTVAYAAGDRNSLHEGQEWKDECGSCHIAYPPKLLIADDWKRLMEGLDNHFGANAVLDAEDNREILDFLRRNAGFRKRNSASSMRISDTPWFTHAHREISGDTWSDPAVKSRSNCVACHTNAERGVWLEGICVPGGKGGEESGERHKRGGERDND